MKFFLNETSNVFKSHYVKFLGEPEVVYFQVAELRLCIVCCLVFNLEDLADKRVKRQVRNHFFLFFYSMKFYSLCVRCV